MVKSQVQSNRQPEERTGFITSDGKFFEYMQDAELHQKALDIRETLVSFQKAIRKETNLTIPLEGEFMRSLRMDPERIRKIYNDHFPPKSS